MDQVQSIPFKSTRPPPKPFRIVKAAVRYREVIYTAWRHSTILDAMQRIHDTCGAHEDQGFVDLHGNWYNRYQSARIAYHARQIRKIPLMLTSEDLWDPDGTPRDPDEAYDPTKG